MSNPEIKVAVLNTQSPIVNFVSPRNKNHKAGSVYDDPVAAPFAGRRSKHTEYNIISNKGSIKTTASSSMGPQNSGTLHSSEDPPLISSIK